MKGVYKFDPIGLSIHNHRHYNRANSNGFTCATILQYHIWCWNSLISIKWTFLRCHMLRTTWIHNPSYYGSYRDPISCRECIILSSKFILYTICILFLHLFAFLAISNKMAYFATNEARFDITLLIWIIVLALTWVDCWIFTLRLLFFLLGYFIDKSCHHIVHCKLF